MSWLVIAVASHLILALVNLADKFLLEKVIRDDRLYTFLVGMGGVLVWLAAPFLNISFPGWQPFLLDAINGASFVTALFLFFKTLKIADTSIVVPFIGGAVPILVTLGTFFFLGDTFSGRELTAIALLVLGSVVIVRIPRSSEEARTGTSFGIGTALLAAVFFALYFVLSKYIFETQGFINGFVLSQAGALAAVVWLFFSPSFRKVLLTFARGLKKSITYFFFVNQLFGAVGFFGLNYAISLANVALVNALQGVQYAFLLIFGALISFKWPHLIEERISKRIVIEKTFAIISIAVGLYLVSLSA